MDIGLVGLGKMGGNMRTRMRNGDVTVVGYDRNPDISDAESLADMVGKLPSPKVVWVMVPAGDITRGVIRELVLLYMSRNPHAARLHIRAWFCIEETTLDVKLV